MPVILLIFIQLNMENVSLIGHLTGIIAALLIKFSGIFYLIMPRYEYISELDEKCADTLQKYVTYFKGTE